MDADIIIVGAGIVGLFTALEAERNGLQPLILEADKPGSGASTGNAGVLHLIQPPPGRLRRKLALLGAEMYRYWSHEIGFNINETRLIIVATSRIQKLLLEPILYTLRKITPELRAKIASTRELWRIEPLITPEAKGGIIVEGYGVVEPRILIEKLSRHYEEKNLLINHEKVEEIKCSNDKVIIETINGGEYKAKYTVNSAGAGAQQLALKHNIRIKVKLKPGTMELYREPRPQNIIARIPTSTKTKGGAIIPWPQGTLYGPDLREDPMQPPPKPGEIASKYTQLIGEEPKGLIERIEGLRTVAKPRDFHIIRPETCKRSIHLLGIESPGLTAAPAIALLALEKLGIIMDRLKTRHYSIGTF